MVQLILGESSIKQVFGLLDDGSALGRWGVPIVARPFLTAAVIGIAIGHPLGLRFLPVDLCGGLMSGRDTFHDNHGGLFTEVKKGKKVQYELSDPSIAWRGKSNKQ